MLNILVNKHLALPKPGNEVASLTEKNSYRLEFGEEFATGKIT